MASTWPKVAYTAISMWALVCDMISYIQYMFILNLCSVINFSCSRKWNHKLERWEAHRTSPISIMLIHRFYYIHAYKLSKLKLIVPFDFLLWNRSTVIQSHQSRKPRRLHDFHWLSALTKCMHACLIGQHA